MLVYPKTMQVRVLFFGMLKDMAGRASDAINLPDGATLADLLAQYRTTMPKLEQYLPSLAFAVNQEFCRPEVRLREGDEVGLLPPVSGGSHDRVRIVHDPIDVAALVAEMKQAADGAVLMFEGTVRDNSHGRRTLYLDYVAYEAMALKQMRALIEEAVSRFDIRDAAIVHRVGHIEVGQTSVAIVVASAHRALAYEASRWLIDTLKKKVPIWKKEYFADGAVWADGEPFPKDVVGTPEKEGMAR